MTSKYIWQYYLVVPVAGLAAANSVAPQMGNPDPVGKTFRRYPLPDAEGNYLLPATHWVASFAASDKTSEGLPSRQRLEQLLGGNPTLSTLLWVRTKNLHHPDTLESDRDIVIASNWSKFPAGSTANWTKVDEAFVL